MKGFFVIATATSHLDNFGYLKWKNLKGWLTISCQMLQKSRCAIFRNPIDDPQRMRSPNQTALILEANDEGEISVNLATHDNDNLAAEICQVIAQKLTTDEAFQAEIMNELNN